MKGFPGDFVQNLKGTVTAFRARYRRGCAPPVELSPRHHGQHVTGIGPRHSLHHLSLLPSGPDEVRDRLLRGGRSMANPLC